jgi:hypothetical protein
MKPRFCTSALGVKSAVNQAVGTYTMLYDKPSDRRRYAVEQYVQKLVIRGERDQSQLVVKAVIFLKKHGDSSDLGKSQG